MSDLPNPPMYLGDRPQESFIQTWTKAITQPREQTYAELAASPGASASKAYLWVFLAGLVSYFLVFVVQSLVLGLGADTRASLGSTVIAFICAVPVIAGLSVLGFMLGTALVQWVAGLFGGHGTYNQLAYVFGAIAAPITLSSGLLGALSAIPLVGLCFSLVSIGIGIYAIVLQIMAVKAVNRFDWLPAVGAVLLPGLVIAFVCGCLVIGGLALLGPMVGNVFSGINQSLLVP